jgi:hypothetical protein
LDRQWLFADRLKQKSGDGSLTAWKSPQAISDRLAQLLEAVPELLGKKLGLLERREMAALSSSRQ